MKKLTIVPAVVLLSSTAAFSQALNTPSVQNIISSRVYRSNQHQLAFAESPWTDMDVSLDYTYGRQNSKLTGGTDVNSHLVTPAFYLEYKNNLSLTASFDYEHANSDNTPTTLKGNAYGPTIALDYEILHCFGIDNNITSLTLEGDFGYTRANATAESGPNSATENSDTYDIGATAIFVQSLMQATQGNTSYNQLALTLAPSYNHDIEHTTGAGSSLNTHFDFASFMARLDYGFSPQWYVGVYGTWNHYLRQDLSGLPDGAPNWATVGTQVVYKLNRNWLFKAGYFYEAFNSGFDSHNVNIRAEYHF